MIKSKNPPIYIIDHVCAKRIFDIMEQLQMAITEMLEHRRYDPPAPDDYDLEALDLTALLANTRREELDSFF